MENPGERGATIPLRRLAVAVAVIGAVAWAGLAALEQPALPEFTPSGPPVDLPADGTFPSVSVDEFEGIVVGLEGKPVVVNIWASWCAPCRTEMPLLEKAQRSYGDRAVILGVASKDDPASAEDFLTDLDITYPNVFDQSGEIRVALGLTAYPTTYVFGPDGQLRARVNGGISEQRLVGLIEDALR
ncbi:MAG: TlpA disulfide reductase family protein [Acidimicrobiales bacterium]|nr:TlpA disulfide reductase family protein [Acidimicrobiales bacterium]